MASQALDDLAKEFDKIDAQTGVRRMRVVVSGLPARELVEDLFAEAAQRTRPMRRDGRWALRDVYDPDVGAAFVQASAADKRDGDHPDDEPGAGSWYELDDRLRYLRERAPDALVSDFTWLAWERMLWAFDWECAYCGSWSEVGQDHVVSIARGGHDLMSNILPACARCNRLKGLRSLPEWLTSRGPVFSARATERVANGLHRLWGKR